jgi:hypothetical protein
MKKYVLVYILWVKIWLLYLDSSHCVGYIEPINISIEHNLYFLKELPATCFDFQKLSCHWALQES